jgi:hypothetical protein
MTSFVFQPAAARTGVIPADFHLFGRPGCPHALSSFKQPLLYFSRTSFLIVLVCAPILCADVIGIRGTLRPKSTVNLLLVVFPVEEVALQDIGIVQCQNLVAAGRIGQGPQLERPVAPEVFLRSLGLK